MPFTLRNLKGDLEDVGHNFDGAPGLEFHLATEALALERAVNRCEPGRRGSGRRALAMIENA